MAEQIGAFIIDVIGKELSPEEVEILAHPLVGGVILFARNYESKAQLQALCRHIRQVSPLPKLIMADQEGGRVQRFITDFTRLPALAQFGKIYDQTKSQALALARDCAWLMASEMLGAGLDLSLGPVLDLNKGVSSVIGDRAFHAEPDTVITLAKMYVNGMREAGMAATAKHFPGHGSVQADSHLSLPIDERSFSELEADLRPFSALIKADLKAVMASHIMFPEVDSFAVGFSRIWLQDILRKRLQFSGAIFSDDLNMEGANISNDYAERMLAAREAGCDFTLLCNNRQGVVQVLDYVPYVVHQVKKEKWAPLQGNFSLKSEPYHENPRWRRIRDLTQQLLNDGNHPNENN